MFVDTAKVSLRAGKGGDGAVSFRHEIYIPKGGPDGGDGGRGGSVIFCADRNTDSLVDFRFTPILRAENGRSGSSQKCAGRSGADLIVKVPVGTIVRRDGKIIADFTADGQKQVLARGGDGGFGNAHFKSAVRQAPRVAEVGEPGEEFEAELELKLLADVGLVGLPNAGKSTFLSVVSNARPEIADYPFTTLAPQLGVADLDGTSLLIADIPGLIAGASEGKGLGHKFLRHVERTAVLLHLVDAYSDDAGTAYRTIRTELANYSPELADRPELVALTKTEGMDPELIALQAVAIQAENPAAEVFAISSLARQNLRPLLRRLIALRNEVRNTTAKKPATDAENVTASTGNSADRTGATDSSAFGLAPGTPVITLSPAATARAWQVRRQDAKFIVTGEKIEKFARRTDFANYASVNRLRDVLKKLGIRAELTGQGATGASVIEIAGKEFTLEEQ